MIVTEFKQTKQGNIAIFADGEFLLSIHPDIFAVSGLSVGSQLDPEELEDLIAQAGLKKAKEKALQLLSYKEFTSHQLRQRLERHVDEDAAILAVERMEQLGLVNDEDYAVRLARDLSFRKQYGVLRVRQEMRQRGLSKELIAFAIDQLEPQEETEETICRILEKKYPLANEDERVRKRAFAALQRMGYQASEIRSAMRMETYYD